jgi:LacI family transcriptional regulator
MKKRTSIHDIAKHLNVSSATVSFVLNGKAEENRIRQDLVDRILAYVKEVGYRPNLIAKSLRTGKSKLIGMLVEGISDPFFSSIARIVEEEAYKLGYKLFYASTDNDKDKAIALIRAFRERQVDGYIIAPPPGIEDEIEALKEENAPVILFDRYLEDVQTTNVVIDNFKGALNAVSHLIDNGYGNIAMVTLDSDQSQMIDRHQGYLKALKSMKQKQVLLKVEYSLTEEKNVEVIRDFLSANPTIDAVFFATNYLAVAGLKAIKSLKLSIPKNLAVVSFDDETLFEMYSPTITAVAQPISKISHAIIKELIQRLSSVDGLKKNETIVLEPELNVRDSSKANIKSKERKTEVA